MPKKTSKKLASLHGRELEHWICRNMPREHCWIVIANIERIVAHQAKTIHFGPGTEALEEARKAAEETETTEETEEIEETKTTVPPLITNQSLQYVYFAFMNEESLCTLVQDNKYFYLIRNQQKSLETVKREQEQLKEELKAEAAAAQERGDLAEDKVESTERFIEDNIETLHQRQLEPVESEIWVESNIEACLKKLTKEERKQGKLDKMRLTTDIKLQLKSVVGVDFINQPLEQRQELWRRFLTNYTKETLDLSGFQLLSPEDVMVEGVTVPSVKSLVLYQNNRLINFDWLQCLPNLERISIWFSNQLEDEMLQSLETGCPDLLELELHYCYKLTGRLLLHINSLSRLNKLYIDNPVFKCQETTYATVMMPKEWASVGSEQLATVLINSDNLTPDFCYYLLDRYPKIERLIVSDPVLTKLHDCTSTGYEKETIVFQSFHNPERGFKLSHRVKFRGLHKDQVDVNQYSESMLNIIKRTSPEQYKIIMQQMAGAQKRPK